MTPFEMPLGNARKAFKALDYFTQGYIEAMFFTECTPDNSELEDATFEDLSTEAMARIAADCDNFQRACVDLLDAACALGDSPDINYDMLRAGNDFWYDRNGHGLGFWDRDLGDVGDKLSDATNAYGPTDLYRGDDGKLYF